MRAVNLLPADQEQARKGPPVAIIVGCAGAVLATAVLAGGYLQASSTVGNENTKLAALEVELAAVPKPVEQPAVVTALPQERQARVAALAAALSQRIAWDRILREISLVLPDDVWLDTLAATAPAPGAAPATTTTPTSGGSSFTLTGFTYSQAAVARLLSRLAVLPDLQGVQLSQSAAEALDSRTIVRFSILGSVRPPGAAS